MVIRHTEFLKDKDPSFLGKAFPDVIESNEKLHGSKKNRISGGLNESVLV